jgi:hypothetical protein
MVMVQTNKTETEFIQFETERINNEISHLNLVVANMQIIKFSTWCDLYLNIKTTGQRRNSLNNTQIELVKELGFKFNSVCYTRRKGVYGLFVKPL